MYFNEPSRADQAVQSVVVSLLRLFSSSAPVRMLSIELLKKHAAACREANGGEHPFAQAIDAVIKAVTEDAENDAALALMKKHEPGDGGPLPC